MGGGGAGEGGEGGAGEGGGRGGGGGSDNSATQQCMPSPQKTSAGQLSAGASLAAQPKPESPAKRRKRADAARAAQLDYLAHLEREGAHAYEAARHTIDVLHAAGVET